MLEDILAILIFVKLNHNVCRFAIVIDDRISSNSWPTSKCMRFAVNHGHRLRQPVLQN